MEPRAHSLQKNGLTNLTGDGAQRRPRKLTRISRACDFCHKRSIKCTVELADSQKCRNCIDFGVSCTYDRPVKKRGVKSARPPASSSPDALRLGAAVLSQVATGAVSESSGQSRASTSTSASGNLVGFPLNPTQQAMVLASESIIVDLVKVYIEVVYPMYVSRTVGLVKNLIITYINQFSSFPSPNYASQSDSSVLPQ
jgi:Fungal Zn(2)-Cys(6) binuclear cluster domain